MVTTKRKSICHVCKGKGFVENIVENSSDAWVESETESIPVEREICENCDGSGLVDEEL